MRASIFVTDDLRFHLCNGQVSYIFEVSPEGIVEHCHFGGAVSEIEQLPIKTRRLYRACSLFFQDVPNYNLNDVAQEYPVFGSSDHRHPAIHIVNGEAIARTFCDIYLTRYSMPKPMSMVCQVHVVVIKTRVHH